MISGGDQTFRLSDCAGRQRGGSGQSGSRDREERGGKLGLDRRGSHDTDLELS